MNDVTWLYNGKVELEFDEQKHVYRVGGKIIPSVTGIISIIDKSGPLMGWAINQCAGLVESRLKPGVPLDEIEIQSLVRDMKRKSRDTAAEAAGIGTILHDYAARTAAGERVPYPTNPAARASAEAFNDWAFEHKVKWVRHEFRVYSATYSYAGTCDAEASVDGSDPVPVEYKTSKAIYPEYWLQLAAYCAAIEEERVSKLWADDGAAIGSMVLEEGGTSRGWIVRFPKDGGDFEAAQQDESYSDFSAFLSALELYRRLKMKGPKDADATRNY